MRIPTKPYQLIDCFAQVWMQEYGGEVYEKSPKDFKFAKEYLDLNGGDFVPDTITGRAQIFLREMGIYEQRRHQFTDFIRNIGSFGGVKPKKKKIIYTTCDHCREQVIQEQIQAHFKTCKGLEDADEKRGEVLLNKLFGGKQRGGEPLLHRRDCDA